MSETARLTVRMPTEERNELRHKARALGISISDLVRVAVEEVQIGSEDEEGELRMAVELINLRIPETLKIIDQTHDRIDKILQNHKGSAVKLTQPQMIAAALALVAASASAPPDFPTDKSGKSGTNKASVNRQIGKRVRSRRTDAPVNPSGIVTGLRRPSPSKRS
jgi:hypothetical protein